MGHEELSNSWTGIVDVGSKHLDTGIMKGDFQDGIRHGLWLKLNRIGESIREISTIASIQAVKDTPRMLPHCHLIPIEGCSVNWDIEGNKLRCTVTVRTHWRTGVEMEALCGVTVIFS